MSGVPACPSQKVLQYFLSVTAQLQLGWAHFLVSAMIDSPGLFDPRCRQILSDFL
jgi:hypothetical protein